MSTGRSASRPGEFEAEWDVDQSESGAVPAGAVVLRKGRDSGVVRSAAQPAGATFGAGLGSRGGHALHGRGEGERHASPWVG